MTDCRCSSPRPIGPKSSGWTDVYANVLPAQTHSEYQSALISRPSARHKEEMIIAAVIKKPRLPYMYVTGQFFFILEEANFKSMKKSFQ